MRLRLKLRGARDRRQRADAPHLLAIDAGENRDAAVGRRAVAGCALRAATSTNSARTPASSWPNVTPALSMRRT